MKLYWRYKKDGKWSWIAVDTLCDIHADEQFGGIPNAVGNPDWHPSDNEELGASIVYSLRVLMGIGDDE